MDLAYLRNEIGHLGPVIAASKLISMLGIQGFPSPVYEIAIRMGVTVKIQHCDGMEGGLEWTDPPTIYLNSSNSRTRQRFTCAHEIGHLLLHPMENRLDETHGLNNPMEVEANIFAAHILMPPSDLKHAIDRFGTDVYSIVSYFGVSTKALEWQLNSVLP